MISDAAIKNDWHVVCRSTDLEDDSVRPVRLLGEDLVLWRTAGEAMAWMDLCIHRGARFSMGCVKGGTIECPYHGWRYAPDGHCTLIPSQPDLPIPRKAKAFTYHCAERYGFIWVCMGEPANDIPVFPEWDDDRFVKVFTGPYEFTAGATRVVENVLDVAHFPFVHDAMLGQGTEPDAIGDYDVELTDDGIRTGPVKVFQPAGDHRRIPVESIYHFWCPRPLIAYLMKDLDAERCFSHSMLATPVEDDLSLLWVMTAANFDKEEAPARILARNDEVFGQDQPVVSAQRPALVPVELAEELHVRADKLSVIYRRWLGKLGVTG